MADYTKRSDGRLQKKIIDKKTGKPVYFYGKTKREINQKILDYSHKEEKGLLFTELAQEWWEQAEQELSYQTRENYRHGMKEASDFFKNARIKEIKPKHVNEYINLLIKKGFAQKTISNKKVVCSRIFEYGVIKDYIEYNPCTAVKLPKNLPKKARKPATIEEENKILETSDVWIFPYIALLTGLRKGEILALQWKDIDFTRKIINVEKSIYFEHNKPKIKLPKTEAGIRIVPLLKPLEERLLKIKSKNPEHFIICNDDGTPITDKKYRHLYNKFRKEFGINASAHQIRHSFATEALESDVEVKSIQSLLGHRQISTTLNIYAAFRMKSFNKAAKKLNKRFSKK